MTKNSTRLTLLTALLLLGFGPRAHAGFMAKNYVVFSTSTIDEKITHSPSLVMTNAGRQDDGTGPKELWLQLQTIEFYAGTGYSPEASFSLLLRGTFADDDAFPDRAYVRYGSDGKHWSTWQGLFNISTSTAARRYTSRYFEGALSIADAQRVRFETHRAQWKKDNPAAEEKELLAWLEKHHPQTLAEDLPFIAFMQFRLEGTRGAGKPSVAARLLLNVRGEEERSLKPVKERPQD